MMAIPNSSIPNTTCGIPREDSFVLLRNAVDSDIPWPGFILGVTASSIWYWCADQVHLGFLILGQESTLSHLGAESCVIFDSGYYFHLWSFLLCCS